MQPTRTLGFGATLGAPLHRLRARGVHVGELRDPAALGVPRHTHATAHVCFPLDAGYRSAARDAGEHCRAGVALFHPAGTTHDDRYLRRGGRFLVVHVDDDVAALVSEVARLPGRSTASAHPGVGALRERLRLALRRDDEGTRLDVEALVLELLTLLALRVDDERERPEWLTRAVERILDDAHAGLTVAELAADAGAHPVALARAFRRELGYTPGELLRWPRVELALAATRAGRSALRASQAGGFSEQSAWSRACRARLGVSPRAYARTLHDDAHSAG